MSEKKINQQLSSAFPHTTPHDSIPSQKHPNNVSREEISRVRASKMGDRGKGGVRAGVVEPDSGQEQAEVSSEGMARCQGG